MAQEEIKLVGSFKDEITPQLKKLTKQIDAIGRSFAKFNRNLRPISKEFGRMASSARTFNEALAQQNKLMSNSSRAMRDYKTQAGKMSGAMRAIQAQREKAMRSQGMSRQQMRRSGGGGGGGGMPYAPIPAPKAARAPKAPKAARAAAPMPMPSGGGAKFGQTAGQSFAASVGGSAIGTTIGMMASQAIMAGVQGLGKLLAAPFQKFASAFAERIGDEMDDIKSAGGLFALDMDLTQESGNERFFKNYNESLRFQEKLNIDMAQSAAALPGVTSQYVNTSRQLTDTIQMVMEKDREGFNEMAKRFGADVSMGGVDASKNAMQTVLKKQTEQVMLQSMGQTGGLPMHIMIQQLMGKEAKGGKLGVQGMTNKFRAAFQKNPLLKNFLLRAEDELAKTEAGSAERLQKVMEVFDAAMPKEVVNKMRGSISGMQEALRSGLLDPQAGLFGMSRANIASAEAVAKGMANASGELLKRNVNDFGEFLYTLSESAFNEDIAKELGLEATKNLKGQELTLAQLQKLGYEIDKQGKIVDKQGKVVAETSTSTTYLFEQIREILAGFGPVLLEFVGFLPMLFDPFTKMTESLMPLRDQAQEFVSGFNKNIDVFEKIATEMSGSADAAEAGLGATLKGQSRGRAAIGKVVKFLEGVGGIDKEIAGNVLDTVGDVSKEGIEGYDKKISQFIEPLFRSLIESDLAKSLSKGFGQIVGGIIRTVYDMITGMFSLAEGGAANALVEGFQEGFGSMFADIEGGMGGMMAKLTDIFTMVLVKIGEILVTKVIPAMVQQVINMIMSGFTKGPIGILLSGTLIMGLVAGIKLVVGGITGLATSAYQASIALMGIAKNPMLRGAVGQAGGAMKSMGASAAATKTGGKAAKALAPLAKIGRGVKGKAVGALAAGVVKMSTAAPGLAKMGKAMVGLGKSIPLLNVAFAGLDFAAEKAAGASTAEAAAGAGGGLVGSVIGGALGSFLGPIGTALGAMLGGWLGKELGKAIASIDLSWVAGAWNSFTGFLSDAWASVSSGASDAWNNLTETIGPLWEGFTSALGNAWEAVSTGAGDIWNNVTGTIGSVWNSFTGALGSAWESVSTGAGNVWNNVTGTVGDMWNGLTSSLGEAWSAVTNEAAEFVDDPFYYIGAKIREGVMSVMDFATNAFNSYMTFWTQTVPSLIGQAFTLLIDAVTSYVTNLVTFWTQTVPNLIGQAIQLLIQSVTAYVNFLVTFWTETLPNLIGQGIEFATIAITAAFDGILSFFTVTIPSVFATIAQVLESSFDAIIAFFTQTLPAIFQSIAGILAGIFEQIKAAIATMVEGIKGAISGFVGTVASFPAQIAAGLEGVTSAILNWVQSIPSKVTGALGSFVAGLTGGGKKGKASYAGNYPRAKTAAKGQGTLSMDKLSKSTDTAAKAVTGISGLWTTVNAAAASGLATAASGMGSAISTAANKLTSAASSISGGGDTKAGVAYNGLMNLNDAIATEMKYKPPGSDLVIANSSETIIPAYKGNFPDGQDTYKGLDFDTMEMASGFNRMKSHTEQLSELADKTASNFTAGFGGALGGGSATLNAMEALGHSFGLITTSGNRPGDPGFHGVNRARDLSNGGGETPEMNAAAAKMASEFGSSLTELIYTPMGFSIKNGAKTGLISPDNHYHHIHVAVAEGLAKAAVFQSEKAALNYEKANMPSGSEPMRVDLSSMTANSSEFTGGGGEQNLTVGDIHVNVSGTDDPKAIANEVAGEILHALEKATYTELFTS